MLLGIVSGILLGGFAPSIGLSIEFIGDLFLQALFALVVPLVMSSMIVGIASLGDVRKARLDWVSHRVIFYDYDGPRRIDRTHPGHSPFTLEHQPNKPPWIHRLHKSQVFRNEWRTNRRPSVICLNLF